MENDLKFDIREWNKWFKERFPKKDLITLKELLSDYEDALFEIEDLRSQIKDLEQDIEDNYKPLPKYY